MSKNILKVIVTIIILGLIAGCGRGDKVYKAKEKTKGGLPRQAPQISNEERGKEAIKITDKISYPGMEPYQGSVYDFVAKDTPQVVVKWFEENLQGVTVNKKAGMNPSESEWKIYYGEYEIDIVRGPGGDDSLIRYKLASKSK